MLAEIIPEGYDVYGKNILKPRPKKIKCGRGRCRVFHPTFPMGRFVSKPLKVKCANFRELRQFLQGCSYVSDLEQFQQADYWLPPEEFEQIRKGDCEDFALWTWRQVMAMGFPARFVVGRAGRYGSGHAWVTFEKDGTHFLVESLAARRGERFPQLSMLRYTPEISVSWDGKKIHYFSHTKRSYTPSLREGIGLWGEWLAYKLRAHARYLKKRANLEGITHLGQLFLRFWSHTFFVILRMLPWKSGKYYGLRYLAYRAVEGGKHLEMFILASDLLDFAKKSPGHRHYGDALHHGNIVLGKMALLFGQTEAAKQHLLQAARLPASAPPPSAKPDTSLAKELLGMGEKKVVIEYFKRCRKFWNDQNRHLEQWAVLIHEGTIPDFDTSG